MQRGYAYGGLILCRQNKLMILQGKVLQVTFTDSDKVPEDVQSQIFDSFLSRGIKGTGWGSRLSSAFFANTW